jgi:hypothetical protein
LLVRGVVRRRLRPAVTRIRNRRAPRITASRCRPVGSSASADQRLLVHPGQEVRLVGRELVGGGPIRRSTMCSCPWPPSRPR